MTGRDYDDRGTGSLSIALAAARGSAIAAARGRRGLFDGPIVIPAHLRKMRGSGGPPEQVPTAGGLGFHFPRHTATEILTARRRAAARASKSPRDG
jgi:hypothetical protein